MNVFDLFARILLDTDEYDRNLNDAGEKAHAFGDALKKGLGTAAKVSAAAITAASAAAGVLVKQSVDGYAEFEQLVGGVETLFKDSADIVTEYANNAYQTAGLSANQYMETVTSFSASLLQGLGGDTEEAARIADLAITDMADNANKMGTAMDSIQNAYQGFAKQNYTMLDNLKLGYGGTQAEMARLINDSGVLGDTMKVTANTVNQVSFDKMIEAIHVVQTEMGITGTTALEASTTIQGSVSSAKSAWSNLVAGIADENANLDQLISNFVESVGTAGGNIIPRVEQILVGIGTAVQTLSPVLAEQIPALITGVLPSLLSAGTTLVMGLLEGVTAALPGLAPTAIEIVNMLVASISENLPMLLTAAMATITALSGGISESLPELIPTIVEVILTIVENLIENVDQLVDAAIEIIMALADGLIEALPRLIEKAPEIVAKLVDAVIENAPKLLDAAFELITKLASGIVDNLPEIFEKGKEIVEKLIGGISDIFWKLTNKGREIIEEVKNGVKQKIEDAKDWGKDLIDNFVNGITSKVQDVKNAVSNVASTVKSFLGFSEPEEGPLSNFHTYAPDMMKLFAQGITDNTGLLKSAFDESLNFGVKGMDFGTANVDFASSAVGQSSAAIINSVAGGDAGVGQPLVVNLRLPDGTNFATWQLPYLIKVASANGTPIAGQQYA